MSVEGESTNDSVVDLTDSYKEVVTPISKARNYFASTQIMHYPIWPKGAASRRDMGTTTDENSQANYGDMFNSLTGKNFAHPQTKAGYGMVNSRMKHFRGDATGDNHDVNPDVGFSALSIVHKFRNTIRKTCTTSLTGLFNNDGSIKMGTTNGETGDDYKKTLGFDSDEMHFIAWLSQLGIELEFGKDPVDSDHWQGVGAPIHGTITDDSGRNSGNNVTAMGNGKYVGQLKDYARIAPENIIGTSALETSNFGQMCDFATGLMKMASDWGTFTSLSNVKSRYQYEEHFFTGLSQLFTIASFEVGQYAAAKGFWWRELVKVRGDQRRIAQLNTRDPATYTAGILKSEVGDEFHKLSLGSIIGSASELEFVNQLNEGATFSVVKQAYEKGLAMGGVDSMINVGRDEDGNPQQVRFVFLPYLPMGPEGNFWGGDAETADAVNWSNHSILSLSDEGDIDTVAESLSDYPLGTNLKTDLLFGNQRGALASLSESMKAFEHAYLRQRGRFNVFAQAQVKNFDHAVSLHNALLTPPSDSYQKAWLGYLSNNTKLHNVSNGTADVDNYSWLSMHQMPLWDREQYYANGLGPRGPHKVNVISNSIASGTMSKKDCLEPNQPVWTTFLSGDDGDFSAYASEYFDIITMMDHYNAVLPKYNHIDSDAQDKADHTIGVGSGTFQTKCVNDAINRNPFRDMITILCDDSEFESDVPLSAASLIFTGLTLAASTANPSFTVETNGFVNLTKPTIRAENWDYQNTIALGKNPTWTHKGRTAGVTGDERYYDQYRAMIPTDASLGTYLYGEDSTNNGLHMTNAQRSIALLCGFAPLAKFGYTATRNTEMIINDAVESKYSATDKPLKLLSMAWLIGNIEHSTDANNDRTEFAEGQGALLEIDGPGAGLFGMSTHMGTFGDGASLDAYVDTATTGHKGSPTVSLDYKHLMNHDMRRNMKQLHYLEYYWRKYATAYRGQPAKIYVMKSVNIPPLSRIRKFMGSLFGYDTAPPFWQMESLESVLGLTTVLEEESAILEETAASKPTVADTNPPIGDKIDTEAESTIQDTNPPIGNKKGTGDSSGKLTEKEKKDSSPGEDGGEVVGKIGDKTVRKKKGENASEAFKRVKGE
jgi:hypothetical protein